jgi:hypothetical protein
MGGVHEPFSDPYLGISDRPMSRQGGIHLLSSCLLEPLKEKRSAVNLPEINFIKARNQPILAEF